MVELFLGPGVLRQFHEVGYGSNKNASTHNHPSYLYHPSRVPLPWGRQLPYQPILSSVFCLTTSKRAIFRARGNLPAKNSGREGENGGVQRRDQSRSIRSGVLVTPLWSRSSEVQVCREVGVFGELEKDYSSPAAGLGEEWEDTNKSHYDAAPSGGRILCVVS